MQVDLSIIIVSWNVWDLLSACLHSIEQISRAQGTAADLRAFGPASLGTQAPTLEVIVVDNASADATIELTAARFPWVRLIRSATNLGFTAGNNIGYAASRGRAIYFLNPDTELVNSLSQEDSPDPAGNHSGSAALHESLWTLYRALMDNPRTGMVGPQLRYADNTIQSSRRRAPTRLSGFFESWGFGRYWPNNPWQRHLHMCDWPPTFRQEVDWLVGAAMLARRSALEEVRQPDATGPFDEGFFMYSEEVDLCHRLKQAGWRIAYVPDAVVIHYEGRSSSQVVAARDIYFHRSMIRYYAKYFGARWAMILRLFLLWNYRIQLVLEIAKWMLGHKREMRAKRIAAYRQVLASKLLPEAKNLASSPEP
jgi:GT2 family glycosyltransferase